MSEPFAYFRSLDDAAIIGIIEMHNGDYLLPMAVWSR